MSQCLCRLRPGQAPSDPLKECGAVSVFSQPVQNDTVNCGFAYTVRDYFEGLANVHHEASLDRCDVDPVAVVVQDLKAFDIWPRGLEKEREPS